MANESPVPNPLSGSSSGSSSPAVEAAGAAPAKAPSAPPPASLSPGEALATARHVEELADQLSACADSIHERVMRDIRRHQGKDVPDSEQAAARALLDAEMELRQRANRLYADAAACIVSSLGRPQAELVRLTADAAVKIGRITRIGDSITLVARLLGLAAAAATGQVLPVLAAIDRLELQLASVAAQATASPS